MVDEFQRSGSISVPEAGDPFFDLKELKLTACGFVLVKNVLYRFSLKPKVGLMFMEGEYGYAKCKILPTDKSGNPIDESDKRNQVKRPLDLIMRQECASFQFIVKKVVVYDFDKIAGKDVYVELAMKGTEVNLSAKSDYFQFTDCEKKLNWVHSVKIDPVTEATIEDFIHKKLRVNVYVDENVVEGRASKMGNLRMSKRGTQMQSIVINQTHGAPPKSGCNMF